MWEVVRDGVKGLSALVSVEQCLITDSTLAARTLGFVVQASCVLELGSSVKVGVATLERPAEFGVGWIVSAVGVWGLI